jgi:DNA-binding protein H-NS
MKRIELEWLSSDDLWSLRLEVTQLLQEKIKAERLALQKHLKILNAPLSLTAPVSERRAYPPVSPKYRNPARPSETWSGRGKQPRWLVAHLKSGRRIDDFAIRKVAIKR